ncbi:MAG: diaminopimelate dehydrogenase [Clostridiales bacterium]|jgi:diaminopimelate dehydrogenase|nr:diaminopimelate dehydrogenase [Clostridiales bacterium]
MEQKINVGIVGYGNLGRGVEMAVRQNPDFELVAIFTRRPPEQVKADAQVVHISQLEDYREKIDVMILCGGSATDLPEQGPAIARIFNTVDSFDNHERIPEYFASIDEAARKGSKVSLISVGWDPGLFSLMRLLGQAVLPKGYSYTFWGRGVSQGHSDAVRRVPGVKNAIQYTIPIEDAVNKVRSGENPSLATREKHIRVCYVVAEESADLQRIEREIKEMPNYFADYDTTVHFISQEEFEANHTGMPHGGMVIRSGETGISNKHVMEFSLTLESNPEFTSSVLLAYARAVYRMAAEGQTGARTVLDVPFAYLSPKPGSEIIKELL